MHRLREVTDERQHREHGLHPQAVLPHAALPHFAQCIIDGPALSSRASRAQRRAFSGSTRARALVHVLLTQMGDY